MGNCRATSHQNSWPINYSDLLSRNLLHCLATAHVSVKGPQLISQKRLVYASEYDWVLSHQHLRRTPSLVESVRLLYCVVQANAGVARMRHLINDMGAVLCMRLPDTGTGRYGSICLQLFSIGLQSLDASYSRFFSSIR